MGSHCFRHKQTLSKVVILLAFKSFKSLLSLLRCYGTMMKFLLNKITPHFLLLPKSKVDQS